MSKGNDDDLLFLKKVTKSVTATIYVSITVIEFGHTSPLISVAYLLLAIIYAIHSRLD